MPIIVQLIQEEGDCWFSTIFWQGHYAIALSVSSWATTAEGIERTVNAIKNASNEVLSK